MLLEQAIADAFGATFEFATEKFVRDNNCCDCYIENPRRKGYVGKYTDDTQMSMAIMEAMLLGVPWEPRFIAAKFLEAFKRDVRGGYARRFEKLLTTCSNVDELLKTLIPNSDRSGAAMRSPPLGLIPDIGELMDRVRIQAAITHNTEAGIDAALAAALATHYFAYDIGPKVELGAFVESLVQGPWNIPFEGDVGNVGWECVQAAITAVMSCDKISDVLEKSVSFTGDVDTVASVAAAASSLSREIEYDLPVRLFTGLENGAYGREYVIALDSKFMGAFGFVPKYLSGGQNA
jgi:ADP-ribosylglycohydrolase